MSEIARTLRAVAEVIVPGAGPGDRTHGAPEIAAENFLTHYLDFVLPGLAQQVCVLLDGQTDGSFADLPIASRHEVLDGLADHENVAMRSVADLLVTLSIAATYGEWSGTNADGELTRLPLGWELTGYAGPVRARPDLMRRP